jgi:hypothetical protein
MGGSSSNSNNDSAVAANAATIAILNQQQAEIEGQRANQRRERKDISEAQTQIDAAKSEIGTTWGTLAAAITAQNNLRTELGILENELTDLSYNVAEQTNYYTNVQQGLDTQITQLNTRKNTINNDFNTSGQITVGYSPTDFYYVMANEAVPSALDCQNHFSTTIIPDASCVPYHPATINDNFFTQLNTCKSSSDIGGCLQTKDNSNASINIASSYHVVYVTDYPKWKSWQDNSYNCYRKELCKNKDNALRIQEIQNNHLGSDQNYHDTMTLYKNEYAKMVNLSVGILAIIAVIFYSK